MVLQIPKTKISLGEKIHHPMSQLPTYKPNREYIEGLVSLSKMKKEERESNPTKFKKLQRRLSELEATMTSDELLKNHEEAFPKISEPSTKNSKYKL